MPTETQFMNFLPLLSPTAVKIYDFRAEISSWNILIIYVLLHVPTIKALSRHLNLCKRPINNVPRGLFSAFLAYFAL